MTELFVPRSVTGPSLVRNAKAESMLEEMLEVQREYLPELT